MRLIDGFKEWYAENTDADYEDVCSKVEEFMSELAVDSYTTGLSDGRREGYDRGYDEGFLDAKERAEYEV